jgi:primosomal protein N' (replication factor Y)
MYVVDVIPFAAGAPEGALSYRSAERVAAGSVVEVTLRGKRVRGMAVGCESVREVKGSIKTAPFMLKSGKIAKEGALPGAIVEAARAVASYHAAPLGAVLAALVGETLPETLPNALADGPGFARVAAELPYAQRMALYARIIAEANAAGRAALIVAPTTIEIARLAREFADRAPVVLSGALKKEKRAAALAAACASRGLVVATPAFAWIPTAKLGAILIERASAGSYAFPKRPNLDARIAAEALANARAIPFYLGDYPLPIEWRAKPDAPLQASKGFAPARIIDARHERLEGESFHAVPPEIMSGIGAAIARGDRAAALAARKGYSPAVVCRDCGSAVRDKEGRALAFSTARGQRIFRSADGATIESADRVCDSCGSWNLLPLGVGVERVADEIREALPDAKIVMIDADRVKTPAQAARAASAAREAGAVIVGTELMLPFLDPREPLGYAAIVSADALLALPFWRARERLIHAGIALRERAKAVDVATRRPEDAAFGAIAGTPSDSTIAGGFFAEETALRALFGYPPSGHLVRIRALVSPARRDAAAREILAAFGSHPALRMPDRAAKGRAAVSFVAKFARDAWPDARISAALAALPPSCAATIDSESLW